MSDEMEQQSKERARDAEGTLIKVEQPHAWEVIDYYVFAHLKRGLNYDMTWMSSTKLGSTVGCWASRPFNRPAYGQEMAQFLKKLREDGQIKWPDRAFLFTHEQGIKARERYIEMCCAGQLKITTSWGPNDEREEDKSRFHKMVPREIAEKYELKFEELSDILGQTTYMGGQKEENKVSVSDLEQKGFVIVTAETIKLKYPQLYKTASSGSGYTKKAERMQLVQDAIKEMPTVEDLDSAMEALSEITEKTQLKDEDVEKLLKDIFKSTETKVAEEEITTYDEAPDLLDMEPSDKDLSTVDESAMDLAEELAEVTGLEHTEEFETPEEVVTAAVTAVEPTTRMSEADSSTRAMFNPDNCFENPSRHRLRIGYSDAKTMTVPSTEFEAVEIDSELYFLVEGKDMPWQGDTRVYMLQEGQHILGDPLTGETHIIECFIAEAG